MKHKKVIFILPLILVIQFIIPTVNKLSAQKISKWNIGIEIDALPYITGGHFAAGWVGKDKWRCRALMADVHKPDWFTTDGFRNHHIRAYALVIERFLFSGWKGWWIGGGPVYWKSEIQSDALLQKATFTNYLINGSLGYNFILFKNVYLSPWAGLSLKVAGDKNIPIDTKIYNLPLLNPEMSLKAGIFF
jgi:hypothetical protein